MSLETETAAMIVLMANCLRRATWAARSDRRAARGGRL